MLKGFTLIELLVVTTIIAILSGLGFPVFKDQKLRSHDAWAAAIVADVSKILMADEFTNGGNPNFADLDRDAVFSGSNDPVTNADIALRLGKQDYIMPDTNRDICFLYGYESGAAQNDDMIVVARKSLGTGAGRLGFTFNGTDSTLKEGVNITAIDCTPGSEGVTGGTWTNYQWLNLIP